MSTSNKFSTREIIVAVALLVIFAVALFLVLRVYKQEGEKRSAAISEEGEKNPSHIESFVKLITIDPVKGDITARLELIPHGSFAKEDGTLARDLKLYVNSATGKQEHDFQKGKRMNPVEVVINMYDGLVTDYPFDRHSAFLELYFTAAPAANKPQGSAENSAGGARPEASPAPTNPAEAPAAAASPTPAASPASSEGGAQSTGGGAAPKKDEGAGGGGGTSAEEDVPLAVDFYGSVPGFTIGAEKAAESDGEYVGINMTIARSSTVIFFSIFIMIVMWGSTIAVLGLVLSIILRGRKIEIGMFSFMAALLFAFAAVRNSQPGVPPIGTYSDFISFFWAEVVIALCLLASIFAWLLRPAAK